MVPAKVAPVKNGKAAAEESSEEEDSDDEEEVKVRVIYLRWQCFFDFVVIVLLPQEDQQCYPLQLTFYRIVSGAIFPRK